MWIGLDDTDGPDGGCTTFLLTELVAAARDRGFDLIGLPRLVRLDPNVPWKTRGNGALAARFGHGIGRPRPVGEIGGLPVRSFPKGRPLRGSEADALWSIAREVVHRGAARAPHADPALVGAPRAISARLYRSAVAGAVPIRMARAAIAAGRGRRWTRDGDRGLVGAASAIAWPGRRRTFELLAYRPPARYGTRREVDTASVVAVADRYRTLFQCRDPRNGRILVSPHTACPILYGLRATSDRELRAAREAVRSEPVDRWLIFASNQGTGDHLVRRRAGAWPPFGAGRCLAEVTADPVTGRGGHVRLALVGRDGHRFRALAFEPTKTLPRLARTLRPGDRIEVAGGRGSGPEIRLERITVHRLAAIGRPGALPACPRCRSRVRSLGRGRGYRCSRCRARFPPEWRPIVPEVRDLPAGPVHPTPSARRHLHEVVRSPTGPAPRGTRGKRPRSA